MNLKLRLSNFYITDIDYKFDTKISEKYISELENLMNKGLPDSFVNQDSIELLTSFMDHNQVKVAVHNELKEILIFFDTKVEEIVDSTDSEINKILAEKQFVLRNINISVIYKFEIEELDITPNADIIDLIHEEVRKNVFDICRTQTINIISSLTSLDFSPIIRIPYPLKNLDIQFV